GRSFRNLLGQRTLVDFFPLRTTLFDLGIRFGREGVRPYQAQRRDLTALAQAVIHLRDEHLALDANRGRLDVAERIDWPEPAASLLAPALDGCLYRLRLGGPGARLPVSAALGIGRIH